MRNKWTILTLCGVALCFTGYANEEGETLDVVQVEEELKTLDVTVALDYDQVSEALGHLLADELAEQTVDFNLEKVIHGMRQAQEGMPSPMNEEEYMQAISTIQENIFLQMAEKNLHEANAFLEANEKEDGVVVIDPKLHYRVEQEGKGELITQESVPLIHYTGKLLDGHVYASSMDKEPIDVDMQQTIPGISQGLLGMKTGEKRTLYIHPDLAYGTSGHLPPNTLVILEVEVVSSDKAPAEDAPIAQEDS